MASRRYSRGIRLEGRVGPEALAVRRARPVGSNSLRSQPPRRPGARDDGTGSAGGEPVGSRDAWRSDGERGDMAMIRRDAAPTLPAPPARPPTFPPTATSSSSGRCRRLARQPFALHRAGLRTVVVDARRAGTLTTPAATGAFRLQFQCEEVALVAEGWSSTPTRGSPACRLRHRLRVRLPVLCATRSATARHASSWLASTRSIDRRRAADGDEVRRRFPYIARSAVSARFRPATA